MQPGPYTWPAVFLTYMYVRKDLSFISNPVEQGLLIAWLRSAQDPDYVTECVTDFGLILVAGNLLNQTLQAIDMLQPSADAPIWIFEHDTLPTIGMEDYVISSKRSTYFQIEGSNVVTLTGTLQSQINDLLAYNDLVRQSIAALQQQVHFGQTGSSSSSTENMNVSSAFGGGNNFTNRRKNELLASLILSSVACFFWMVTCLGIFLRSSSEIPETALPMPKGDRENGG